MCNWFLENTRDWHVVKGFRESFIDYCDTCYFQRLGNFPALFSYVKGCHESVLKCADDVIERVNKLIFELTLHEQLSEQLADDSEDEDDINIVEGLATCSSNCIGETD